MGKDLYANGAMEVRLHGRYARMLLDPDHPEFLGVDELDTEELARGQLKDKNGKFTGRPPKTLPRALVDAMRAEHYSRINAELEASLSDQVKTMIAISKDEEVEPATRLKAAIYVYERFMGKIPDKVNVTAQSTVDDLVDSIMFDVEEARLSKVEEEINATRDELDGANDDARSRSARARARQRAARTQRR